MRIHFLSPRGLYQTVLLFCWFGVLSCRAGDPYPEILTIGQVQGELDPRWRPPHSIPPFWVKP